MAACIGRRGGRSRGGGGGNGGGGTTVLADAGAAHRASGSGGTNGDTGANARSGDDNDEGARRLLIDILRAENEQLRAQLNTQSDALIRADATVEALEKEVARQARYAALSQKVIANELLEGKRYRRKIRDERRQRKRLEDALIVGTGVHVGRHCDETSSLNPARLSAPVRRPQADVETEDESSLGEQSERGDDDDDDDSSVHVSTRN